MKKKKVGFLLSNEVAEELREIAFRLRKSQSKIAEEAIKKELDKLKNEVKK